MFDQRLLTDLITFFVIINPIGIVPEFLALGLRQTAYSQRLTALRGVLFATLILLAFIVLGQIALGALGVDLSSFEIAGGLILLIFSLQRILEAPAVETEEKKIRSGQILTPDVSLFPLAMPMIAGPGAILVAVLLTNNDRFTVAEQATTTLVMLFVLVLTFVILYFANAIQRVLGTVGADVLSRVLALVLAALAVERILDGIRAAFLV